MRLRKSLIAGATGIWQRFFPIRLFPAAGGFEMAGCRKKAGPPADD